MAQHAAEVLGQRARAVDRRRPVRRGQRDAAEVQAEARAANFEGEIADTFDVKTFTKDIMKRVVKHAHRDARGGASDSDASDSEDSSDSESSSSASPPPTRAGLDDAAAIGKLAERGEKDAIESIFAFLDKDDSGTVTVREMIIGVRKEPALARTLGLGEGRVDQDQLVEMFSKWDENGDRELDRAEFAAIFGPSIADAERAEARRRAEERAVIIAKAVEEEAFAKAEAALAREQEKKRLAAEKAAARAKAKLAEEERIAAAAAATAATAGCAFFTSADVASFSAAPGVGSVVNTRSTTPAAAAAPALEPRPAGWRVG